MSSIDEKVVILVFDDRGGMRLYAESLCSALASMCDSRLVCVQDEDGLVQGTWWARMADSFHHGRRLRRIYDPGRFRRIARTLVAMHKPDIVHITSNFPCIRALVSQFGKLGVKVVHTVHDPVPHPQRRSLRGKLQSWYSRRYIWPGMLQRMSMVHVHSKLHAEILCRENDGLKMKSIYVVQHGGGATQPIMNGRLSPPELPDQFHCQQSILFFGRIEHYKGLDTLFAALPEVLAHYPEGRVIVAGAGQLPDMPACIADKCVVINRYIDEEEIRAIFEAAALVVLPYRSATQTGVISLAASVAKPCLVTDVGALPELVVADVTGAVVASENPPLLARKIIELLADSHRLRAMGLAARDFMRNTYAWPLVAAGHLEAYRRMVKS